jgi:aspartyl-tRNA(Asn)/glutamyl-tRNA(Gln) amidotransferase subunit A
MMPTYGRVSLRDVVPLSWTLDHAGPLTRTVRDAAIITQVIAGYDPLDPYSEARPVPDWLAALDDVQDGGAAKGLRIGVPRDHFWKALDTDVERLVSAAIDALTNGGATIVDVPFPHAEAWNAANGIITLVEAATYQQPNFPARRDDYGPQVAGLFEIGRNISSTDYANALRALQAARHGGADALLDGVDVLAVPTVPITAPTIDAARANDPTGRIVALTQMFDFTGQPVLTVPCGLASDGLPVSISFVARRWDEASAFRAGRVYELIRGPFPSPTIA